MKEEPPCDVCKPFLMPENEEAMFIYNKAANQVRVAGMGDIVGLDYNALKFIMDLYGIGNQRECFEKVNYAFNKILEAKRANSD